MLGDALKVAEGDVEAVGRTFHDQRYDEMHALQQAQLVSRLSPIEVDVGAVA